MLLIMKKILILAAVAVAAMMCGCSPKIANNIDTTSISPSHPGYAVIYFYRPSGFVKARYTVHLNEEAVFTSKSNAKSFIKVDKPGTYEIWAKTEARDAITLNVEMGRDYYVKAGVDFGVALWRPSLEIVAPEAGQVAWSSIR